jgi:hypothetical protein
MVFAYFLTNLVKIKEARGLKGDQAGLSTGLSTAKVD